MRNIRARRRFKATLILLLVISVIAFFESRIEAFAPELKILAEERIQSIFGGNFGISIGSIDGGIIRPIALRDVRILGPSASLRAHPEPFDRLTVPRILRPKPSIRPEFIEGRTVPSNVEAQGRGMSKARQTHQLRLFWIKSMVSNYRVWDLIFPDRFKRAPHVEVDFETKNRELSGFVTIEGAIDNAVVRGYVSMFGADRVGIEGRIKNGIAHLILRPKAGLIKVESNFAADGVLIVTIKINHLKLRSLDIAGDVVIKNIIVKNATDGKEEYLEGEIEAKNVILNYKPFFDLKASYRISKEILEVSKLDIGNMFYLDGRFGLREPYLIDIVALTDNMNLPQVISVIDARYGSFVLGTMNSKLELKGAIGNLKSDIRLEMRRGRIGEMNFEYLSASLKGDGPMVRIEDSRIMRESGPLVLGGEMDLRHIGKESFFENIKILGGENTMVWDGWDTAKWQDVREFKMTKNVAGDFNIRFKKFVNDDKVDESLRDRDQFELGYNLHPNDSIKLKFGDNSNFFGLEHKDKF